MLQRATDNVLRLIFLYLLIIKYNFFYYVIVFLLGMNHSTNEFKNISGKKTFGSESFGWYSLGHQFFFSQTNFLFEPVTVLTLSLLRECIDIYWRFIVFLQVMPSTSRSLSLNDYRLSLFLTEYYRSVFYNFSNLKKLKISNPILSIEIKTKCKLQLMHADGKKNGQSELFCSSLFKVRV